MINGTDMTNVKRSLRRVYFIDGMLGGMTDEAAAKYSALRIRCLEDAMTEQGNSVFTCVLDDVTDRIMAKVRKSPELRQQQSENADEA